MQLIYRYRFYLLALLFIANVLAFWPGYMLQDTVGQYQQAVSMQFSDHHPPIMSLVWHYLDLVHKGEGLMFALQLVMLYGAMAMLLLTLDRMVKTKQRQILCLIPLLLPIYPQVLVYAANIVKDTQYAFAFLLAASILAYYSIRYERPSLLVIYGLFFLMLYGAAVKYQGQFCVIVLAFWLAHVMYLRHKVRAKIIAGLAIYALLFFGVGSINNHLVPQQSKNYSWEFVKLYDLAAISIATNSDLVPDFNKTDHYTFQKLEERFTYPVIDPYIYAEEKILMVTKDPANMQRLYKVWLQNVFAHPVYYLRHRAINMGYALLSRPGFDHALHALSNTSMDSSMYQVVNIVIGSLFYILMSHFLVIVLGVGYFGLAIYSWKSSKAAPVLLGFTSVALLMVSILFFMSMAGVPRYTYISIVMIHAAHIFAYKCYADRKRILRS